MGATRDVHAASNAGASTRAAGGKGDLKGGKQWEGAKETGTTSTGGKGDIKGKQWKEGKGTGTTSSEQW